MNQKPINNADTVLRADLLRMAGEIVTAYMSRNPVSQTQIPELITSIFNTLAGLDREQAEGTPHAPAVPIKKSITPDYIVCLEDGKQLKMLKRYLRSTYNMSPEDYRAKWNLPADYPMVAPNYAKRRSEFAKKSGLGKASKRA